jgi:hypothetical protein
MKKTALIAAGIGLVIALASPDARALTTTFGANVAPPSDVTTVAGGCGYGWHRGPWGGCRRNFGPGWRCSWRWGRRYCRW